MATNRLILVLRIEMPPLKRRRGLAGSIISTAVSAALIGSAVGLTVYRLWRDRGKESLLEPNSPQPQQLLPPPPPPPYQQGEWQPAAQIVVTPPTPVQVTPRSVRKSRQLQVTSPSKRPIVHHRKSRSRVLAPSPPIPTTPTPYYPAPQTEFNFGLDQEMQVEQTPLEDKMDWIGDKLSMLIEQGKRALGAEVVVMSEAKEDEVDDGSPGWEEEEEDNDNDQPSRSGSVKHLKRPRSILSPSFNIPIPHAGSSSLKRSIYDSTPTNSNFSSFASSSAPGTANYYTTPRKAHSRGISFESGVGLGLDSPLRNGFVEDPSAWDSPEIREGMEKARSRYFERRIGGC